MKITIFGSCRQKPLETHFPVTSIQEALTYPHYTKEIIQAIEFCKEVSNITSEETKFVFRTGILQKRPISSTMLNKEYADTDMFVLEIASRFTYKYKSRYVHHILKEGEYRSADHESVEIATMTDEEIETDLLRIKELLHPKPFIIASHIYTRASGKRYALIELLDRLCAKYAIPFFNPSKALAQYNPDDIYLPEETLAHFTNMGNKLVGLEYKSIIDNLINNTSKKVYIHSWLQKTINYPGSFWGLGDMLRGAITMNYICNKLGVEFYIDMQNHPISNFLVKKENVYHDIIATNKENILFHIITLESGEQLLASELAKSDIVYFTTNGPLDIYSNKIDASILENIRSYLKLNPIAENAYTSLNLPAKTYDVLHVRMGDQYIVYNNSNIHEFNMIHEKIKNYITPHTVFICDSVKFKSFITDIYPTIRIIDGTPCHIGCDSNLNNILYTLIEYTVLQNASKINSFSVYGWLSGFAHSASVIFEVPIHHIK